VWLSAHSSGQEIELRAQSADTAARSLAEAGPSSRSSSLRVPHVVASAGAAGRAGGYNLGRLKAAWLGEGAATDAGAAAGRSTPPCASQPLIPEGFAPPAEARGLPRAPPAAPSPCGAPGAGRPRAPSWCAALVHRLRTGESSSTRTRGRAPSPASNAHRRGGHEGLPVPRIPGRRPRVRPHRPAREDLPLRRSGRRAPAALEAGRTRWETMKARARRAAQELAGAAEPLRRAAAAAAATPSKRTPTGSGVRGRFPSPRPDQRDAIELVKPTWSDGRWTG